MHRNYDVIIVGAGPAGATLAYELASRGIRVLVLEKATLPRYKCCAGGLTFKAVKLLGTKFDGLIDNAISSAIITFDGANPYRGSFSETIMYTVMREKFDYALVKRAEEAGAEILEGLEAQEIHLNDRGVDVSTSAGQFRSQFIAGADGAKSIVARALGIENNNNHMVGIETEVIVADEELVKRKSEITVDLGRVPAGYAWVFPKADHLSIGIACLAGKAKDLKRRYYQFLESLNLSHCTIAKWDCGLLPFCTGQAVVARSRAILVGDAAGLADPLSGEGLHNAILSAQLAAPALEKSLRCGEVQLNDYRKSVEEKIIQEMKIAYVFSRVLAQLPSALFKLIKREERVWKGCCYMLRGEMNYSTIRKKISTLGGLYEVIMRRFLIEA